MRDLSRYTLPLFIAAASLVLMWAARWKFYVGFFWWMGVTGLVFGAAATATLAVGWTIVDRRDRRA